MPTNASGKMTDVLKRVGTLKNELLVFCVIGCLILNLSAYFLDYGKTQTQQTGGLVMHLATIPILILFGAAYFFALFYLPSSRQELMFTEEATKMVLQHESKLERRARLPGREGTRGA
jgi:hypothetical protein